ncbi:MAG: S1C family serine protease [Acidobacteriota bacterium]|nr:S1C family serine protease [Acidobacteriota bacterium]
MFAGLPELAARPLPSSVQVDRGGSGVIWNSDGVIVTNGVSRLLHVEGQYLQAATIGNANGLRVGQIVAAVGNPFGVAGAVTAGIVHAAGESNWIQADVRLARGNSGGMLADAEGRVVGTTSHQR